MVPAFCGIFVDGHPGLCFILISAANFFNYSLASLFIKSDTIKRYIVDVYKRQLLGCIFRKLIAIQAVFKLRIRYQLLRCSCSNLQSYLLFSFFYRKMLIIKIEGFVFQTLVTRCCAPVAYSSCCCLLYTSQGRH